MLQILSQYTVFCIYLAANVRNTLSYYYTFQVKQDEECQPEAIATLNAAINSKSKDQAKKLFKHALTHCPNHPKILNHFGEFLEANEEEEDSLLEADHLFIRALTFSDEQSAEYTRALQNRERTALVVEKIDGKLFKRIEETKKAFKTISEVNSAAVTRAKKEAYVQHIHHTLGIEGNTMTIAETKSILETKLAIGGKNVMEHVEIFGLDAAFKYIYQTLVDRVGEITMQDILEIHKRVLGNVDPLEAGMLRRTQVYVGNRIPPSASHVEFLMKQFILWINLKENVSDMNTIKFAALVHYKLVYIHPFVDGNGRTSRLLMNLILMQAGFPPVIIRKQDRLEYFNSLEQANNGDIKPFIRFIAGCLEQTLDDFLLSAQDDYHGSDLSKFGKKSDITSTDDRLDHHDAIILSGKVDDIVYPSER